MVATNVLARALFAPLFDSAVTVERGRPDFARHFFLEPGSRDFVDDGDTGARITVALLRAEAGRYPHDRALHELVGERRPVRGEASRTRPDADGGRALLVRTIVGTGRRTGHA